MRTTLTAIIFGLMGLGVFGASEVHADPTTPPPTPRYNGPLQSTWELWPLGGNGGQPIQCVPMSTCAPIVVNPNG